MPLRILIPSVQPPSGKDHEGQPTQYHYYYPYRVPSYPLCARGRGTAYDQSGTVFVLHQRYGPKKCAPEQEGNSGKSGP